MVLCAGALAASSLLTVTATQGGCPCKNGGGGMAVAAPVMSPYVAMPQAAPMVIAPAAPVAGMPVQGNGSVDLYAGATPPPGTIGQTYQLRSRPVPASMHPRTGMVDLRIANASNVVIHSMNANLAEDKLSGFQDQHDPTMWHFSSEPLLPGTAHIYRIEAQVAGPNGVTTQERYIRLVMGRLIEVNF